MSGGRYNENMTKRPVRPSSYTHLTDLKKVGHSIKEQAKRAEEERKQQQKIALQTQNEQNLFRHYMASVTPLAPHNRALLAHPKPPPFPMKRLQGNEEVMLSSLSDEFDVEALLDKDEALSYRQSGISLDILRKLKRGHWNIQAELDLHGYRRDDAREALHTFVHQAGAQGLRYVRIIHGKGLSSPGKTPILKAHVLSWLMQSKNVLAYTQARAADGGAGALIVLLRSNPV
ncbi:MAG: Smr/MutS family protein [Saezia sp.]